MDEQGQIEEPELLRAEPESEPRRRTLRRRGFLLGGVAAAVGGFFARASRAKAADLQPVLAGTRTDYESEMQLVRTPMPTAPGGAALRTDLLGAGPAVAGLQNQPEAVLPPLNTGFLGTGSDAGGIFIAPPGKGKGVVGFSDVPFSGATATAQLEFSAGGLFQGSDVGGIHLSNRTGVSGVIPIPETFQVTGLIPGAVSGLSNVPDAPAGSFVKDQPGAPALVTENLADPFGSYALGLGGRIFLRGGAVRRLMIPDGATSGTVQDQHVTDGTFVLSSILNDPQTRFVEWIEVTPGVGITVHLNRPARGNINLKLLIIEDDATE